MGSLLPNIRNLIELHGPLSISTYMSTLLTSNLVGYYMKKDVFGQKGDFITAPEISQLFGEMIGINILRKFESENNCSRPFHLIELGPGRGTLMNDLLRTFSVFPDFFKKVKNYTFIEVSPSLKEHQVKNTHKWSDQVKRNWIENVAGLEVHSEEIPIFIAQEFFDAIPIHVFKKTDGCWKELKVSSKMGLVEERSYLTDFFKLSDNFPNYPNGQTLELSPASWAICDQIRKILDKCFRGEGIFIDYGQFKPSTNSLRAIYQHKFCSIFENIGDADLSADVDFQSLMYYLGPDNKYNFTTQGRFLESIGIRHRAKMLFPKIPDIEKSVDRLVNPQEMGKVYKVLEFSRK